LEPGVVSDQLNRVSAPVGIFLFALTVSTASRATLGGMLATDASGIGARGAMGRTSDLRWPAFEHVMDDGSTPTSRTLPLSTWVTVLVNSRLAIHLPPYRR